MTSAVGSEEVTATLNGLSPMKLGEINSMFISWLDPEGRDVFIAFWIWYSEVSRPNIFREMRVTDSLEGFCIMRVWF